MEKRKKGRNVKFRKLEPPSTFATAKTIITDGVEKFGMPREELERRVTSIMKPSVPPLSPTVRRILHEGKLIKPQIDEKEITEQEEEFNRASKMLKFNEQMRRLKYGGLTIVSGIYKKVDGIHQTILSKRQMRRTRRRRTVADAVAWIMMTVMAVITFGVLIIIVALIIGVVDGN